MNEDYIYYIEIYYFLIYTIYKLENSVFQALVSFQ